LQSLAGCAIAEPLLENLHRIGEGLNRHARGDAHVLEDLQIAIREIRPRFQLRETVGVINGRANLALDAGHNRGAAEHDAQRPTQRCHRRGDGTECRRHRLDLIRQRLNLGRDINTERLHLLRGFIGSLRDSLKFRRGELRRPANLVHGRRHQGRILNQLPAREVVHHAIEGRAHLVRVLLKRLQLRLGAIHGAFKGTKISDELGGNCHLGFVGLRHHHHEFVIDIHRHGQQFLE
jgi:hypothetical protein